MFIIVDNLMVELFFILSIIFMNDVVEDFRWHVFGSSHGELGDVFEFETGTIVN
jgi:hypothetical protein